MKLTHAPVASGSSIVTLTMNPAIDITTNTSVVAPTDKMRCGAVRYDPGGGGINVARVAHVLGASATAVFPAGGPIGELLTDLVARAGVAVRRVPIAGSTRQSFTVDETSTGRQYRFVLPGPSVTFAEQCECLNQLRAAVAGARFVVASGSLPPNVHPDYYQRVAHICEEHGARLVLDTSGGGLRHITDGVFLLKPSVRELRECVGRELDTEADQLAAAHELISVAARTTLWCRSAPGAPCLPHRTTANAIHRCQCRPAAAWRPATRWWPPSASGSPGDGHLRSRYGWESPRVPRC